MTLCLTMLVCSTCASCFPVAKDLGAIEVYYYVYKVTFVFVICVQ